MTHICFFTHFLLSFFFLSQAMANDHFKSTIFSYDNVHEAKGCHVKLTGVAKNGLEWIARDINETDLPYVIKAFGNESIMKAFGYGKPIDEASIRKQFEKTWLKRFQDGHPHGALILLDSVTKERLGFYVAGEGELPGGTELAGIVMEESWDEKGQPKSWRQGLTSSILQSLIKEWAPEVHRLGTDSKTPENIKKAFCCFQDQPLSHMEATASPSNPASWHVLSSAGFHEAHTMLASDEIVASYEHESYDPNEWEERLLFLFSSINAESLDKSKRHLIKGLDGQLFTISHHPSFKVIKFHFERSINR